jgi:hypothetical protein
MPTAAVGLRGRAEQRRIRRRAIAVRRATVWVLDWRRVNQLWHLRIGPATGRMWYAACHKPFLIETELDERPFDQPPLGHCAVCHGVYWRMQQLPPMRATKIDARH